jgi:hypothetical protein
MDRAEDRLAHPTIRADDWPHPRSVIAGTDAFVCRDLAELRGRTPRQHPAQQLNTCLRWLVKFCSRHERPRQPI